MKAKEQLKVFIMNNDIITLNLYVTYFKYIGITSITPFDDLHNCLNSLRFDPDLIFLDQNTDLLENLKLLKKIGKSNPKAYVIMISGNESIGMAIECLSNGAFDYIVKNGDEKAQFRNVIEKIISEKQRRQKGSHSTHKPLHSL
jgi:DNA-binding NtrC family response regulator